jgi:hypothetical protein
MSEVPSIKGSVFSHCVEKLLKLISAGKTSWDELPRHLEPGDIEIVKGPIHATQWYDIRIYERILLLNQHVTGDGSNELLLQWGARSAERLIKAGLYQQLEYLGRTQFGKESDSEARFLAFGRDLRLLTSLTASVLNFMNTASKVDPERDNRYIIEYTNAADCPDVFFWTNQGFINRMAAEHGTPDLWRWERPSPDRVVYWMTRPV